MCPLQKWPVTRFRHDVIKDFCQPMQCDVNRDNVFARNSYNGIYQARTDADIDLPAPLLIVSSWNRSYNDTLCGHFYVTGACTCLTNVCSVYSLWQNYIFLSVWHRTATKYTKVLIISQKSPNYPPIVIRHFHHHCRYFCNKPFICHSNINTQSRSCCWAKTMNNIFVS